MTPSAGYTKKASKARTKHLIQLNHPSLFSCPDLGEWRLLSLKSSQARIFDSALLHLPDVRVKPSPKTLSGL